MSEYSSVKEQVNKSIAMNMRGGDGLDVRQFIVEIDISFDDRLEAEDVLRSEELQELYYILRKAGARHCSALARALDHDAYTIIWGRAVLRDATYAQKQDAYRRRRSTAVLLRSNLLEDDQKLFTSLSERAKQRFVKALLDDWFATV